MLNRRFLKFEYCLCLLYPNFISAERQTSLVLIRIGRSVDDGRPRPSVPDPLRFPFTLFNWKGPRRDVGTCRMKDSRIDNSGVRRGDQYQPLDELKVLHFTKEGHQGSFEGVGFRVKEVDRGKSYVARVVKTP